MGIARRMKREIFQAPPVLLLIGRPQDAWLATWSQAEAVVPHPIDPVVLAETAAALLRPGQPCPQADRTDLPAPRSSADEHPA